MILFLVSLFVYSYLVFKEQVSRWQEMVIHAYHVKSFEVFIPSKLNKTTAYIFTDLMIGVP